MKFRCGHCGTRRFWKLGNGEYRCRSCRQDFKPKPVPILRLLRAEWLKLAELFLIGANSPTIKEKLGKSMAQVQKALRILRACMTADIPEIFSGTVEVDKTYLGGQWKNKREQIKTNQIQSKRGLGTTKQPVFGILARCGQVWVEPVTGSNFLLIIAILK